MASEDKEGVSVSCSKDCSCVEERTSDRLTLAFTHGEEHRLVGITLKGVKHWLAIVRAGECSPGPPALLIAQLLDETVRGYK